MELERGTMSRRGFLDRSLAALTISGIPLWYAREVLAEQQERGVVTEKAKRAGPNDQIVMAAIGVGGQGTGIMNAANKVVFSRTMTTADWANTTIAPGDTTEEVDKLRQGGDGHIVVWGGVSLWRSLMGLDLIDEWHLGLHPYVADEGTRLFENVPHDYRLDLISSTPFGKTGVLELQYRRRREARP